MGRCGELEMAHRLVFHDRWIPSLFPTTAVPLTRAHKDESNVSSLIDQIIKEWSRELIDQLITPFIA